MKIRLMTDYECFPLWESPPTGSDNINPRSLPLSRELLDRLDVWQSTFDATLNHGDPASSAFATYREECEFELEGLKLAAAVQKELGAEYDVIYFSTIMGRNVEL